MQDSVRTQLGAAVNWAKTTSFWYFVKKISKFKEKKEKSVNKKKKKKKKKKKPIQNFVRTPSLLHKTTISWPELESESLSTVTEVDLDSISTSTAILQLHHIDSLSFHKTPDQLFNLKLQCDMLRADSLLSLTATKRGRSGGLGLGFSSLIISDLTSGSGEYFTCIGVGTPPKYAYMVLDTSSDVVWSSVMEF